MAVKGWIYIIVHNAMPGLVKIGYSLRDPELRAKELEGTGVPGSYLVAYAALVESPRDFERTVHQLLGEQREGKEWFRCEMPEVLSQIRNVGGDAILYEHVGIEAGMMLDDEQHAVSREFVVLPCPGCGKWLRVPSRKDIVFSCPKCKRSHRRFADGQLAKAERQIL